MLLFIQLGSHQRALYLFSQGISDQGQAQASGSVATVIELCWKGDGQAHNEGFLNMGTNLI